MKTYLTKFLAAYDWDSFQDFVYSLFPSQKYHLQHFVGVMSILAGIVNYMFGITPALAMTMFIAIIVEIVTGIRASKRQGLKFESFKFSRAIIKIAVWMTILFIVHAFEREFEGSTNYVRLATYYFFNFVFVAFITAFLIEYITSILENVSILKGKEKTALIEALQGAWKKLLGINSKKTDE